MRDIALTMILLGIIPLILFRPHVGALAWAWVAFMNPHREVYSYLQGANLNLIIAVITIVGYLVSREKHAPHFNFTLVLIILFAAWTSLTTFTALDYTLSYDYWLQNIKTFFFLGMLVLLIDRPARIHALVLIFVISLGYWGLISALQTVASAGQARLFGPPNSMIADNNQLALALVMVLPLVEYCRFVSKNVIIRNTCMILLIALLIAIFGTYSRGGLISLAAVLLIFLWRAKNRVIAVGIVAVSIVAISLLPQQWSDRMATIEAYQSDRSFQGRLEAWKTAIAIGVDRPILGGGYRATEDPKIYQRYRSEGDTTTRRAVHNAYLQVLADHGFVGLGLYVLMFLSAVRDCRWVVRRCSGRADRYWLAYLASMVELGFIGYAVGGSALSVAYYDGFLVLIVVSSILRDLARREIEVLKPQREPAYALALPTDVNTTR